MSDNHQVAISHPYQPSTLNIGIKFMNKKVSRYSQLISRIKALLDGETDEVAVLATVACEIFHEFDDFHWVGFYRVTDENLLTVGPYQGGHGCLRIPFDRGVCGAAARTGIPQKIDDVNAISDHIACSSSTQSELVVPLHNSEGQVVAVLDLDSDNLAQFDTIDVEATVEICALIEQTVYR